MSLQKSNIYITAPDTHMHAGQIMGSYAATFALVGGTFAVADCLAETVRGEAIVHVLGECAD